MIVSLAKVVPQPHFSETHAIDIAAPIDTVWQNFTDLNIFSSRLNALLFKIRGLSFRPTYSPVFENWHRSWYRVNTMFEPLTIDPPHLLVLKFRPHGPIIIGWSFQFRSLRPDFTRVITQTRVMIPSVRLRHIFQLYWIIIRLPSGAIRLEILRLLKNKAEQSN